MAAVAAAATAQWGHGVQMRWPETYRVDWTSTKNTLRAPESSDADLLYPSSLNIALHCIFTYFNGEPRTRILVDVVLSGLSCLLSTP